MYSFKKEPSRFMKKRKTHCSPWLFNNKGILYTNIYTDFLA